MSISRLRTFFNKKQLAPSTALPREDSIVTVVGTTYRAFRGEVSKKGCGGVKGCVFVDGRNQADEALPRWIQRTQQSLKELIH